MAILVGTDFAGVTFLLLKALLAQMHSLRLPGGTDDHREEALNHLADIIGETAWWKKLNADLKFLQEAHDNSSLGKEAIRERKAAASIQAKFRGCTKRCEHIAHKHAALAIQSSVRGFHTRLDLSVKCMKGALTCPKKIAELQKCMKRHSQHT